MACRVAEGSPGRDWRCTSAAAGGRQWRTEASVPPHGGDSLFCLVQSGPGGNDSLDVQRAAKSMGRAFASR